MNIQCLVLTKGYTRRFVMSISYLTDFGIYDLATLTIYYKIGNESGSYDFPPPRASLKRIPSGRPIKRPIGSQSCFIQ